MHTTQDIDATTAAPALTITDDKHLCDIVYQLASKQLVINAAEAEMQAQVEASKKAFADATETLTGEIKKLFAAVEAYAAANKDRLFPVKGDKRKKTFAVLQHKLQYRSSESVEACDNAAEVVLELLRSGIEYLRDKPGGEWNGLGVDDIKAAFKALIRQPAPELDKDAVKDLLKDAAVNEGIKALAETLHLHGIRVKTLETFKLAFTFTPEQTAA